MATDRNYLFFVTPSLANIIVIFVLILLFVSKARHCICKKVRENDILKVLVAIGNVILSDHFHYFWLISSYRVSSPAGKAGK